MIACVLIRDFAIAMERRDNPTLADKPLLLHAAEKVYAASPDTAVQPGMSLRKARLAYPDAVLLPARLHKYRRAYDHLIEVLQHFTNRVQPGELSPSTSKRTKSVLNWLTEDNAAIAYLDFENLKRSDLLRQITQLLKLITENTGVAPCLGLAEGKFPARIAATLAQTNTYQIVPKNTEAEFLSPLPVGLLPLDREIERRLHLLGLSTLGQLAALPTGAVGNQFGKSGLRLHQLAMGIDSQPVVLYRPRPTAYISHHMENALSDTTQIKSLLHQLATQLSERLQTQHYMTRSISLTLTLDNHTTFERHLTLRQPANSAEHIARKLDYLLQRSRLRTGVVAVDILLGDLIPTTGQQLDLFTHVSGQDTRLQETLAHLITRYGTECFYWIALHIDRVPERCYPLQQVDVA